jgi:hypothetical protein
MAAVSRQPTGWNTIDDFGLVYPPDSESVILVLPHLPSRHRQQIDLPAGGDHGVLEVSHELPRGIHAASPRPWLAGVVSAKDIEQGIPFGGFQPTVSRSIGTVGVQGANQPWVFLHDDPQDEIRGWGHTALFEFPPAARQWAGQ